MIISHKHKFIFFKSRKTAGSSIQAKLAQFCGDKDIITGQYQLGIDDNSHSTGLNMDKFYTSHPHPILKETKQFLSPEIWNSYFKFSFVRNPFDIAVSRYHWDLKGKQGKENTSVEGFKQWVKNNNLLNEDSISLYCCDNNQIELDFVGRYETLQDDLDYICSKIGIPKLELPFLKSGFRDKIHYSNFYDEETKNIVEHFYNKDIKTFNYFFNSDFISISPKPIITPQLTNNSNINGPSLIKTPNFLKNKLGKYYLYFASHDGDKIKLAYSDNLNGPWNIYPLGTLQLKDTNCLTHIASPDVHIEDNQIVMYYHGDTPNGQFSFRSTSLDGINFTPDNKVLGLFYFRVFNYLGETYAIAKNKNIDGIVYRKENDTFKPAFNLIDNIRHTAVYVEKNYLYIFYSIVGEAPESLYICKIKDWEIIDNYKFKSPKYDWEGANQSLIPSKFGMALGFSNQLRDPCIFKEDNNLYMLYSYGGESGIAITKLIKNEN